MNTLLRSFVGNGNIISRSVIGIGLLILGVVIAFTGLRTYSLLTDETYQALCCKNYSNSPLAMMLFYIGNKWMAIFGDDLLSLRILSRLCIVTAIGIGGGYLWHKTKNLLLTGIICMLSAIFANLGDMSFYNWDTGAYPIAAIGTLILLVYMDRPSVWLLMILGFITGVMTAFRVPLIGFMGIVAIVLIVKDSVWLAIRKYALYTFSTVVGLSACAYLMTGSLQSYIDSFNSDNIISGHTGNILSPYLRQFIAFFPRNIYCGMVTFLPILLSITLSTAQRQRVSNYIICEAILFVIGFSCVLQYGSPINCMLSGIGIPLFLATVFWLHISKRMWGYKVENSSNGKNGNLKLMVLLLSMFLLGLGSDTAFQRWNIIAYFPMSIGVIWPLLQGKPKSILKKGIVISLPALMLMVPFKNYLIEDWTVSVAAPQSSKLYGVHVMPPLADNYAAVNDLVNRLETRGLSYTFAGMVNRFLYSYEFEQPNRLIFPLHLFRWEEGDINLLKHFERKCDVVIFTEPSPKDYEILNQLYGLEIIEKTSAYTMCGDKRTKELLQEN